MSSPAPKVRKLWTVAEFATSEALLAAVRAVRERGHTDVDTYSPYPLHRGSEALGLKPSRVPAIAAAGALFGVTLGYGVMYYMNAVDFPINVGNRPPHSPPMFIPITFELMVLLALMRLGDDAYGVTIARELEKQTGREVVIASVYATLERLEERGLVSSSLGDSTPERGGRAKRYFRITGPGLREARDARRCLMNLWKGLLDLKGEKA